MSDDPRCSTCGASIEWGRFAKSGKPVPLDPGPSDDGNLLEMARIGGVPLVCVVTHVERVRLLEARKPLRLAHFASCPDASKHRRRPSGTL